MYQKYKESLASVIAFFLGLIFMKAGMEKLTGLTDIIGPPHLIRDLADHNLELFGKFIAYSQLIIGFLLINNRFRTLASIMLMPMLLSILVITISLNWRGTPYVLVFLLISNVLILVIDYHKIKFIISDAEYPILKQQKITRTNYKLDIIYLIPLILMLLGSSMGWSIEGRMYANRGTQLLLIIMIVYRVFIWVKTYRTRKRL
jgi:uncharacterized membrane protein YphA (DoxX/SURF4 family)